MEKQFEVGDLVFGWSPESSIGIVLEAEGEQRKVYWFKSLSGHPVTENCVVITLEKCRQRAVKQGYLRP